MPINKFTPQNTRAIIASVRNGNYLNTASASVGVSYRSVASWIASGRDDENSQYHEFYLGIEKAKADFEEHALSVVVESNQPKYLMEVLARKQPAKWSPTARVNVEINEKIENFMSFLCENLADDPIILERILKIAAEYEKEDDV